MSLISPRPLRFRILLFHNLYIIDTQLRHPTCNMSCPFNSCRIRFFYAIELHVETPGISFCHFAFKIFPEEEVILAFWYIKRVPQILHCSLRFLLFFAHSSIYLGAVDAHDVVDGVLLKAVLFVAVVDFLKEALDFSFFHEEFD